MADLLLISDIPRLRQVFMRLADDPGLRLRVVSTLEEGGEEIATDKPAMVFVQTHVSGFSAEILLMHLKKRLGRRRTRFVLLSPPDQVSGGVLKLYHSYLDTSLSDHRLLEAFRDAADSLTTKGKKRATAPETAESAPLADATRPPEEPAPRELTPAVDLVDFQISPSAFSPRFAETVSAPVPEPSAPSPEDREGVAAAGSRLSVYSEFSGSLESAVSQIRPAELPGNMPPVPPPLPDDRQGEAGGGGPLSSHSKRAAFLFWLVPLVILVVVVTLLQHRGSGTKPMDLAPQTPSTAAKAPVAGAKQPPAESDAGMGDRAMLTAIAESRGAKGQAPPPPVAARLTALPAFIPRDSLDKGYGAANPGWERYMGLVTEFKVFREGGGIKAIQVIDKGGQGIPDNFMRSALTQLAGGSSFVPSATEKKDGYEIQRGQVAANIRAVFYRDAKGGRLRAFVVTWQ